MRYAAAVLFSCLSVQAQTGIILSPLAVPNAGQPGVTNINVKGCCFPSGVIPPGRVTVTLQPATAGAGPSGTTQASTVQVVSGATQRIAFQIPSSISLAAPTAYQVTVAGSTTGGATFASSNSATLVVNPAAQISVLRPVAGNAGQTLQVAITGLFTNFLQGPTQASFGPGVSVGGAPAGQSGPVTVNGPSSATAQLTISPSAPSGPRTVTVATGVQEAVLTGGFAIGPGTVTANPASGPPTAIVALTGTGFGASEPITLSFDSTVAGQAMSDSNGAFRGAQLTVPASATPGSHTITATGQTTGIAGQTTFLIQTNWTAFRFDAARDGYNPTENVLNASNVSGLQVLWKLPTVNYLDGAPAIVDGVIYWGTDGKFPLLPRQPTPMPTMYALQPANGQIIWQTSVSFNLDASAMVDNGTIYDSEYNGGLDAFDAASGKLLWSASTGGSTGYSSPVVGNGTVYVGALDNNVHAFDASTGTPVWTAPTGNQVWSSPALANGTVYAGSYDNNVYAFDAASGKQLWSSPTGGQIFASPAVANGMVYVGSQDGNMYAFNAATGQQVWVSPAGRLIKSSAAVANGMVYVGSYDKNLYAFDAATGKQLWTAPTGGEILSSPAVANGVVYVGSFDDSIYAFDAGTGAQLWSFATGDTIVASPAVADGVLYICSRDKTFYAFSLPAASRPK